MKPETGATEQQRFRPPTSRVVKSAGVLVAVFGAGVLAGAGAQGIADKASPGGAQDESAPRVAAAPASTVTPPEATTSAMMVTTQEGGMSANASSSDAAPTAAPPRASGAPALAAPVGLAVLDSRLVQLRNEIERLSRRVVALEQRQSAAPSAGPTTAASSDGADEPPPLPVDTPEDRYAALVSVGVEAERADEILERQSRQELARLELRDRATREGWVDSEQYRETAAAMRREAVSLRSEIGDSSYDLYLYSTGASNRVQIDSVMQGSAAYEYGLQPGDVIESYADRRIFNGRELREATTGGIRGETVPVRIRRGDQIMEAWLPRGPIGITLEPARAAPVP